MDINADLRTSSPPMRRLSPAALAGLLIALPNAGAHADDRPIPQDSVRQQQWYRDSLEFSRRTLGRAYEEVGKKDPRWDGLAREALEAAARLFSRAVDPCAREEDVCTPAR